MEAFTAALAVAIGLGGNIIGDAIERVRAADGGTSTETSLLTQLGVTAACIVVAFWMLRRSDSRDAMAQASEAKAHDEQLAALNQALEVARTEAETFRQLWIEAVKQAKNPQE